MGCKDRQMSLAFQTHFLLDSHVVLASLGPLLTGCEQKSWTGVLRTVRGLQGTQREECGFVYVHFGCSSIKFQTKHIVAVESITNPYPSWVQSRHGLPTARPLWLLLKGHSCGDRYWDVTSSWSIKGLHSHDTHGPAVGSLPPSLRSTSMRFARYTTRGTWVSCSWTLGALQSNSKPNILVPWNLWRILSF